MQIGSALASSLGQLVRMPESRLRVLVACGAAGGIAATFNAPITGVFFGVEVILREFSIEAIFTVMLSAMVADVVSQEFLGAAPFLSGFPSGIALATPATTCSSPCWRWWPPCSGWRSRTCCTRPRTSATGSGAPPRMGSACCRRGRPRPAVAGGAATVRRRLPGHVQGRGRQLRPVVPGRARLHQMVATSLTIGIGGSGGVFAPSLFIGATSGMAFGEVVNHLFGPGAGQPARYSRRGHGGGVHLRRPGAPDVVGQRGGDDRRLHPHPAGDAGRGHRHRRLPALSYGTIYTTKLLRRGIDIDAVPPVR